MAITDYLNKTLTGGTENNTDSPITDLVNKNLGSTTPVAQNATTGNNQTSDQIVGGVNITELANRLKSGQDTIKMPKKLLLYLIQNQLEIKKMKLLLK